MSEDFWFRLLMGCGGFFIALVAAVGYLILVLKNKADAAGELRIGKLIQVKGAPFIVLAVAGVTVALVGLLRPMSAVDDDWSYDAVEWEDEGVWEDDMMWAEVESMYSDDDSALGEDPFEL